MTGRTIIPAPTVALLTRSMTMKPPVLGISS
jgi:hypothetical protein